MIFTSIFIRFSFLKNVSKERHGSASLPASWPIDGAVKFDNVTLCLGPNLDPDLDTINFEIASGENIGLSLIQCFD